MKWAFAALFHQCPSRGGPGGRLIGIVILENGKNPLWLRRKHRDHPIAIQPSRRPVNRKPASLSFM